MIMIMYNYHVNHRALRQNFTPLVVFRRAGSMCTCGVPGYCNAVDSIGSLTAVSACAKSVIAH